MLALKMYLVVMLVVLEKRGKRENKKIKQSEEEEMQALHVQTKEEQEFLKGRPKHLKN